MRVRVRLYGTLRRFSLPDTPGFWEGDLPDGARLIDLVAHLGATPNEVAGATIDDVLAPLETHIPTGAEIRLVTPMGGG
jgi:sulfur carrier protein ThiS